MAHQRSLKVPKRSEPDLVALLTAPDEQFRAIEAALKSTQAEFRLDALVEHATKTSGLDLSLCKPIVSAIVDLYSARSFVSGSVPEFVEVILESLGVVDSPAMKKLLEDRERIKERVTRAVSIGHGAETAGKVRDLQVEHERRFCAARILTDARAVFHEDVGVSPDAAYVFHSLRLSYHVAGGKLESLHVTLRDEDLGILEEQIARARRKKASIAASLQRADWSIVE